MFVVNRLARQRLEPCIIPYHNRAMQPGISGVGADNADDSLDLVEQEFGTVGERRLPRFSESIAVQDYGPDVTLIDPAFIHSSVTIFGKVTIRAGASIWPNAVIRAENHEVDIGPHSNVQDFCMVHVGVQSGTHIGAHCSITHHSTVHGAHIGDNCLVGINATLMDGVVIGDNCTIAGGSFIPEGTIIPDNSVVMGVPGRVVRTENRWVTNRINAWFYWRNAQAYARGEHREWSSAEFEHALAEEHERLIEAFKAEQASRKSGD